MPVPVTAVIGAQWGDEGKGKIVDMLSRSADVCVRFNGGNNAGHTVINEYGEMALHLVPVGIFRENAVSVIGCGTAVDPEALRNGEQTGELQELMRRGISAERLWRSLKISANAHLIMPWHRLLDAAEERERGAQKIGTTGRGIGPCYADRFARTGVRVGDLLCLKKFRPRFDALYREKDKTLRCVYECFDLGHPEQIWRWLKLYADLLSPYIFPAEQFLRKAYWDGKRILLEGAQGVLLDADADGYPYVTSSLCGFPGAYQGSGLPRDSIGAVIGVAKAYLTRVGAGPFPTEMDEKKAGDLRERAKEYGATTGRPRRIGWLDVEQLRQVAEVQQITAWAITKLDVLNTMGSLRVCVGYDESGKPKYEPFRAWEEDIQQCTSFADLPEKARVYLSFIQEYTGVPVRYISTGPKREQIIVRT